MVKAQWKPGGKKAWMMRYQEVSLLGHKEQQTMDLKDGVQKTNGAL